MVKARKHRRPGKKAAPPRRPPIATVPVTTAEEKGLELSCTQTMLSATQRNLGLAGFEPRNTAWCPSCRQAIFREDPNPTVVVEPPSAAAERQRPASWCQLCGQPLYAPPPLEPKRR